MKKITALLLTMIMVLSLCACGGDGKVSVDKLEVGDQIVFGSYEQDGYENNGKEPIEWIVCGTIDSKYVVLLSKYGLDYQPYNTTQEEVTWETCSLRKWLNKDFYSAAFNDEEKESVSEVKLKNPDSKSAKGGNDTNDKVWIFNKKEANNYEEILAVDDGWVASTYYAESLGAEAVYGYWLRIPKMSPYFPDVFCAACTYSATAFPAEEVQLPNLVRPVIALPLDSDLKVITTGVSYFEDATSYEVDNTVVSPTIGMTEDEVLNSSWGEPDDINTTTNENGTREQWVYDNRGYLYFEDGVLTTIQER